MTEPMTPDDARAREGEAVPTLAELYGAVPDLIPHPMTSEAWVRRYRDGYDAGFDAGFDAGRAATLAAVRERVEDCEAREIQSEAQEFRGDDGDVWVKRDDVLDVLDALAGEGS